MNDEMGTTQSKNSWTEYALLATLGLTLLAIAIPIFLKPRTFSSPNSCLANLKQLEGAKATWALEHKKWPEDRPLPQDIYGHEKYIKEAPICPQGGAYTIGLVSEPPRCSLGDPSHQLITTKP